MRLQSIERKKTNKYLRQAGMLLLSAFFSAGTLAWILSAFSITPGEGGPFGGGMTGGMIRAWNMAADTLGNSDFITLPQYDGAAQGSGLFLLLCGLVIMAAGYALLRSRKIWLLLIVVLPFFAVQLLWEIGPSAICGALFLCACLLMTLYCLYPGREGLPSMAVLLSLTVLILGGGILLAGEDWQQPNLAAKAGNAVETGIEHLRYGSNPRGDGTLKPRNFNKKETALEIKMENPDSLYLRGFVGSIYRNGSWKTLSNSDYYSQKALFYWLGEDGFSGLTQLRRVSQLLGEDRETGNVTVTNKGASRKYIYTPYELAVNHMEGAKNWSDSFLTSEGFRGAGEYQFRAASNMVKDWPELAAKLFTIKTGQELSDWRIDESHYNVRLYEDYTRLTDKQSELLESLIGPAGDQKDGHIDYKEAIRKIRACLEENFIYTENIGESKTPVEDFLKEKKGCDVHYASAAALMFRYYGIAARYVEGYIVTPEDVKDKAPQETIAVPAANNHAWTEIYIDSFGWVPIEATPEYYDRMEQPDLSRGLENLGSSNSQKNTAQELTDDLKETDPSSEEKEEPFPWKALLLLLAADLLFVLLIYLAARLVQWLAERHRRKKAFSDPDVKQAICAIYQYMSERELPVTEEIKRVGNKAAFSPHSAKEEERVFMLAELERMKKERHEKKNHGNFNGNGAAAFFGRLRRRKRENSQ